MAKAKQKPWEHRRWRGGLARAISGALLARHWILSLAFCGVAVAVAYAEPKLFAGSESFLIACVVWMFALVGVIWFIFAVVSTGRLFRFRGCHLQMRTVPGVIGGRFAGSVVLPRGLSRDVDLRLELYCEKTVSSGDGVSTSREWQRRLRVDPSAIQSRNERVTAPFEFIVPYGLHDETDSSGQTGFYMWYLRVSASMQGPDLDVLFRVPVFRTEASDSSVADAPEARKDLAGYLRDQGERRRVRVVEEGGARVYTCTPAGLKMKAFLPWFIAGVVCLTVGIAVPATVIPQFPSVTADGIGGKGSIVSMAANLLVLLVPCVIGVVFSLFGLLFAGISLRSLVSRRTWVRNGRVHHAIRLFGLSRERSVEGSAVSSVDSRASSSSNGVSLFDVVIGLKTGDEPERSALAAILRPSSITVATDIATEREAKHLAAQLRNELNVPEEPPGDEEDPGQETNAPGQGAP